MRGNCSDVNFDRSERHHGILFPSNATGTLQKNKCRYAVSGVGHKVYSIQQLPIV